MLSRQDVIQLLILVPNSQGWALSSTCKSMTPGFLGKLVSAFASTPRNHSHFCLFGLNTTILSMSYTDMSSLQDIDAQTHQVKTTPRAKVAKMTSSEQVFFSLHLFYTTISCPGLCNPNVEPKKQDDISLATTTSPITTCFGTRSAISGTGTRPWGARRRPRP